MDICVIRCNVSLCLLMTWLLAVRRDSGDAKARPRRAGAQTAILTTRVAAPLATRVGIRTFDVECPLHFLRHNKQLSGLHFAVPSRRKGDDEGLPFAAPVRREDTFCWIDTECSRRSRRELGIERSALAELVAQLKGDGRRLVQARLDSDRVIDRWITRVQNDFEAPTTAAFLLDQQVDGASIRSQRLKPEGVWQHDRSG